MANQFGDLDLAGQITILGAGREATFLDGNGINRVLDVQPGATVTLADLTMQGGQAEYGKPSGGVRNRGELTLANISIARNRAGDGQPASPPIVPAQDGGNGGGIFNSGELTLLNCLVANHAAGHGSDLPAFGDYFASNAGAGGSGGGVYYMSRMDDEQRT